MAAKTWRIGRVLFCIGRLDYNYHGPVGSVLRNTFLLCQYGDGNPISWRCWRFYIYGPTGACVHLDFRWLSREEGRVGR